VNGVAHIGVVGPVGQGVIDDGLAVFEDPHAGGGVVVVFVNRCDGPAQDIRRVHLVDGGLDIIVENQDTLVVGHEHAQIQITQQIHERQTAEINAGQAEPFHIVSVGKSHGRILSNSTDFRKKKFDVGLPFSFCIQHQI
jgi:hypothetical protein